jgi:hypothetical protein
MTKRAVAPGNYLMNYDTRALSVRGKYHLVIWTDCHRETPYFRSQVIELDAIKFTSFVS